MSNPDTMRAMVLEKEGGPLLEREMPVPDPAADQIRIRVHACGVCRTDLHILDRELPKPELPRILGHEIVGTVERIGGAVSRFVEGDRVGVPWLARTCGKCRYCRIGRENLCDHALFTGYSVDGGYAEYAVANSDYCFRLPEEYDSVKAAPLLCAGLIGYRAYRMCGRESERIGLYGFGASAHILAQIAVEQGKRVYAFTRAGDAETQRFAVRLGCVWAGDSAELPPDELDAAIIFAPVGKLVPPALLALCKGGVVVCAGIHMSDIPSFPYEILWQERIVRSVANLERRDGDEFFAILQQVSVKTDVEVFTLEQANEALAHLREGKLVGAAVLQI